jgi:hypothetical protein
MPGGNESFAMPFYAKNASFYQDRLGTNIRKLKKEDVCLQAATTTVARRIATRPRAALATGALCESARQS